jgi:hypothetical protein
MGHLTSPLLSGAIIMGNLVVGLFFLKFWSRSQDRLFLIFALAFWILAAQRILLAQFADVPGTHVYIYGIRLLAFVMILFAIVDKNRGIAAPQRESS